MRGGWPVAVGSRKTANPPAAQLELARALRETEGAPARAAVEHALAEAERLVEITDARSMAPEIHLERAELARHTGDEVARLRELREAHRLYTEMGATGHAERVARELGL